MPIREDYILRVQDEAKKLKDRLIKRSAEIFLSIGISQLNRDGIKRLPFQYEMFNQYPPFFLHKSISAQENFLNDDSIATQPINEPFALYVHLPFCIKKCTGV